MPDSRVYFFVSASVRGRTISTFGATKLLGGMALPLIARNAMIHTAARRGGLDSSRPCPMRPLPKLVTAISPSRFAHQLVSSGVRPRRESLMIGLVRAVTLCAVLALGLVSAQAADS